MFACSRGDKLIRDQLSIHAPHYGNLSVIKLLIESGADICAQNNHVLINALRHGRLSVVKLLIDLGANINGQNGKSLGHEEINKYSDMIESLKKIDY